MSVISQTNANNSKVQNWWTAELRDGVPIDHLFKKLDSLYRGNFTGKITNVETLDEWRLSWAQHLTAKGVTGNAAAMAIDICLDRHPSHPPTCGEFVACARQFRDPQTAHAEAIEQMHKRESGEDIWSHPAVYWAAVKIGAFDLNNIAWSEIKNRWTAALDEMRRRENLEPVPPRRVALPAPGRLSVPDDVAKKRMHTIMQNLTSKMSMGNGGVDMLKTD